MSNPMCNDLELAGLNRERVKQGYCNEFYDQQAHAIAQWQFGEPKPNSVVIGELPYASKKIRLDSKED